MFAPDKFINKDRNMKTMKFFFVILLLFCTNTLLSAQPERTWIEKYNGEEYTIRENEHYYVVANKKYTLSYDFMTADSQLEGESIWDYQKRRKVLSEAIDKIANGVFHFDRVYTSEAYRVSVICTFDVQTNNYAGGLKLSFEKEIKDYATLEKVSLLEKALLESGLNAGETKVVDPSKKYFTMDGVDVTRKKE